MIKFFVIFVILYTSMYAFSTSQKLEIGKQTLRVVHESYDEYSDKGITLKFYTLDSNTTTTLPLLSLVLENEIGSCGQRSIEEGAYKIKGNKLFFYTHWSRDGTAYDAPIGDRIQVYQMEENKTIHRLSGRMHIKTSKKDKSSIEHYFGATFVEDSEAENLAQEVSNALTIKKTTRWK